MTNIRGRHYRTGELVDVTYGGDRVTAVRPAGIDDPAAPWIAPGFFDLQVNGCLGVSFNSERLTVDDISGAVREVMSHGVTGMLATLVTYTEAAWTHALRKLVRAIETDPAVARAVPGFHLEGPSVSPEDGPRGAHLARFIRAPDLDEFRRLQDAAGGRIRLVTLAPEFDNAIPFIERLTADGVVVAIGHTNGGGEIIRDAVRAGARLSTHLGNGCAAALPRRDNSFWAQMADDRLTATLIADGWHLLPTVFQKILQVKTPARSVLISDVAHVAGLPPGQYHEWGQQFEVLDDGRVVVPGTRRLAGSGFFLDRCIGVAIADGGVSLAEAVEMASHRPREVLGLPQPDFVVGAPAEFVQFHVGARGRINVTGVVAATSRCKTC